MDEDVATGTEVEPTAKINPTTRQPWTDEERQIQSERAKALVAQGKFGGQHHGRRKKAPAYAVIAAEAQRNGREMARTLVDIARHGDTQKLQMDAIKMLTDMELKAQQNRREEEEHLMSLPRDELQRQVLQRLAQLTGEDYDIDLGPDAVEDDADDDPEDVDGDEIEPEAQAPARA
jgi:hypothetical protein